ncbi:MAG: hypothetical protein N2258_03415 [Brevinematales bacterium]|nr:hypothetical protein [Brevinematales bacterium]
MLKKLIFFLLLWFPLFGIEREKSLLLPADIIGCGGTGITADDKFGMLFMNPASFGITPKGYFSLLKLGIRLNYDLYQYYQSYDKISGAMSGDMSSITPETLAIINNLKISTGLNGPLAFGYLTEGVGFLLYNDFHTSLYTKPSFLLPYADFGAYADFVFLAGFGTKFELPFYFGKIVKTYGGIAVKYINRLKYENKRLSFLKIIDMVSAGAFKEGYLWGQAIGSDVGLMFKGENISVGITVKDWFNTFFSWNTYDTNFQYHPEEKVEPTYYPASFNFGISYKLNNYFMKYGISDWIFAFDIVDVFYFEENYFLKLRFGTEVKFLNIFRARAGVYKGYPTFGIGAEIPFLNINFAYYTEELSSVPGYKPQQNFVLEIHVVY